MSNKPESHDLINANTNEVIRSATPAEIKESFSAFAGDTGAISVEIDGEDVTCYVD